MSPESASRDDADDPRRPWLPAALAAHGFDAESVRALSYIVVEEMLDDGDDAIVTLTVSAWPVADERGRLRFRDADVAEWAVPASALHDQVYRGWLRRPPRIGDVFAGTVDAAALATAAQGVWREPLDRVLGGAVYDLSAEARKVAKLALYGSVVEPLTPVEVERFNMEPSAERASPPAKVRARVDPPRRRGRS